MVRCWHASAPQVNINLLALRLGTPRGSPKGPALNLKHRTLRSTSERHNARTLQISSHAYETPFDTLGGSPKMWACLRGGFAGLVDSGAEVLSPAGA